MPSLLLEGVWVLNWRISRVDDRYKVQYNTSYVSIINNYLNTVLTGSTLYNILNIGSNCNMTTRKQIPIVCPGHTRPLAELQFISPLSGNETYLVSACHDKNPMLRDGVSGDWIGTWSGHKGAVWSTKMDPSGYLCATASGDFSVKVWDGVTGKELYTYPHKHIVKTVDFSPDSKKLASGGHEGLLRVYDLSKGEKAVPIVMRQNETEKVNITKCQWFNNKIVLAASSDGSIQAWDIESKTVLCTLHVDAEVRDLEFSRNIQGKDILTVAAGSKVSFFHLVGSEDGSTFNGFLMHEHPMPIHFKEEGGASLHPSGEKFVAGGSDLWVRVFDTMTGEELECHRGHHGPIRCLRYAPDGETYATGSEDGTIRLWKTNP